MRKVYEITFMDEDGDTVAVKRVEAPSYDEALRRAQSRVAAAKDRWIDGVAIHAVSR